MATRSLTTRTGTNRPRGSLRRLAAALSDLATSAQFGPDAGRSIGRHTGARC